MALTEALVTIAVLVNQHMHKLFDVKMTLLRPGCGARAGSHRCALLQSVNVELLQCEQVSVHLLIQKRLTVRRTCKILPVLTPISGYHLWLTCVNLRKYRL